MNDDRTHFERQRLWELMADRASGDLGSEELAELHRLLIQFGDVDSEEVDRLAAMIDVSLQPGHPQPLPQALRARIAQDASREIETSLQLARRKPRLPGMSPTWTPAAWLGWGAAAACLLVAVSMWWTNSGQKSPLDLARQRQQLLQEQGTVTALLAPPAPDGRAHGDVVWSSSSQSGFMRLQGLPINDPTVKQYQLWIFDPSQDERYPIDGGVFDVTSEGEIIVPIHAAIRAKQPNLFAITVEKPGGVVVSQRDPLVLLGKVAVKPS